MITYSFKIDKNDGNGLVNLTTPFQENSDFEKLGEELDTGFLILWLKNDKPLPIMSYVEYTISDGSTSIVKKFYIGRDDVKLISKASGIYSHNIELIELYKKLEKHLDSTLVFTQPIENDKMNYTLLDCVERVRRVFPLGDTDGTSWNDVTTAITTYSDLKVPSNRLINKIDTELQSVLKEIESPQFVFSNPTFREAIDGILKYVNAVGKLETRLVNGKTVRDVLGAEFYGYLKSIVELDKVYFKEKDQNIEDYSTNLESFTQNNIVEKNYDVSSVSHPNNDNYDVLRSPDNDYSVTDSNFCAVLPYPIKSILHFYTPMKVRFTLKQPNNQDVQFVGNMLVDLYDNILTNEQYATLSLLEKRLYFRYKVGDNYIEMNDSYKELLFEKLSLPYAYVSASIKTALKDNKITLGSQGSVMFVEEYPINSMSDTSDFNVNLVAISGDYNYGGEITNTYFATAQIKNILFKCDFTTEQNTRIGSQKEDISDSFLNSSSNMQQQDRVISFTNFANTIFSTSQRQGNASLEVTCKHKALSDLIKIGDYTNDNLVCTEAEYIYYREFIIGKYSFSKNYNRISTYIGINSDIRAFQMPTDKNTYERLCKREIFLECGVGYNGGEWEYGTSQSVQLSTLLSKTFNAPTDLEIENNLNLSKVTCAVITFPNDNVINERFNDYLKNEFSITGVPGILLPVITKGGGNQITFEFGFNEPIYCGSQLYTDNGKTLKKPIPYAYNEDYSNLGICGNVGFLRTLQYSIYQAFGISSVDENNKSLPLISSNITSVKSTTPCFTSRNNLILKDSGEILKFNHTISCLSVDENLTLGLAFTEYNYAISQDNNNCAIYLSKRVLGKFEKNYFIIDGNSTTIFRNLDNSVKAFNTTISTNKFTIELKDEYKNLILQALQGSPNQYNCLVVTKVSSANKQKILYHLRLDGETLNANWAKPINFILTEKRKGVVYDY